MAIVSDVRILARTRMNHNRVCIGGYSLSEQRYVRLLVNEGIPPNNHITNMMDTVSYHIGEIYTIEYENRTDIIPPHCEDVIVLKSSIKYCPNDYDAFLEFLSRLTLSNLHIKDLFNGLLQWQNGSGFLIEQSNSPNSSVMVVSLNHDLYLSKIDNNYYYYIDNGLGETFKVKYVGVYDKSHIRKVPAGTFLRFSLARWWDGNGQFSNTRAYLQLSAIY